MYLVFARDGPHRVSQIGIKQNLRMQIGVLLAAGVGKFWLDVHWKENVKNTGEDWGWRAGGGWGLFHWGPVDTDCEPAFQAHPVGFHLPLPPASVWQLCEDWW